MRARAVQRSWFQEQAAVRIQAIMKGSVQRLRLGAARRSEKRKPPVDDIFLLSAFAHLFARFATARKLAKEKYDMEQSKRLGSPCRGTVAHGGTMHEGKAGQEGG